MGDLKKNLALYLLSLASCLMFLSSCHKTIGPVEGDNNISTFPDIGEPVLIPEGEFIMGASERHGRIGIEVGVDAMPEQRIYLKSFYMDKYEVVVAQYRRFIIATGHTEPSLWGPIYNKDYPPVRDNDPISDVSWYDADSYCRWAGKRLPTEEEWEKAARGTDGRRFPWGNGWKKEIANTEEYVRALRKPGKYKRTHTVAEVGSFKGDVSPYGIYDMGGNVIEWTSSWYKPYPGSEIKRPTFGETLKVARGGTWMAPAVPFSFAFNRYFNPPDKGGPHFGIRCVRDAE